MTVAFTDSAFANLRAELAHRHRSLTGWLASIRAECLVATRGETVTYLTGYTTKTFTVYTRPIVCVLTADGRLVMIVPESEADAVAARVPGAEVRAYSGMRRTDSKALPDGLLQFAPLAVEQLDDVLSGLGPGSIAVDGLAAAWPPIPQLTSLCRSATSRQVNASDELWRARLQKSTWEVDRMREAAAVLEAAHLALRSLIRPGMTEREITRKFTQAQLEAGAHEVGPTGVVAGPQRGLFGDPTDKRWERDDLLYVDGTTCVNGYWSDFCRTYAARPATPTEHSGYERALRGLSAAVDIGMPGTTIGDVGAAMGHAMQIDPAGVGFGRFGHGIGLYVPEPPSLHPEDLTALATGMTICIEPAVRHEGINFVVEEQHVLTANGFTRISAAAPAEIQMI